MAGIFAVGEKKSPPVFAFLDGELAIEDGLCALVVQVVAVHQSVHLRPPVAWFLYMRNITLMDAPVKHFGADF